jgi:hypothetical protein
VGGVWCSVRLRRFRSSGFPARVLSSAFAASADLGTVAVALQAVCLTRSREAAKGKRTRSVFGMRCSVCGGRAADGSPRVCVLRVAGGIPPTVPACPRAEAEAEAGEGFNVDLYQSVRQSDKFSGFSNDSGDFLSAWSAEIILASLNQFSLPAGVSLGVIL